MIAYVNGKRHALPRGRGEATLLSWLRSRGLTGTKLGCGEGGCGACTVSVTSPGQPVRAVNACLMPLCSAAECEVTTVEGIGTSTDPHPVQDRIAKSHGSQCGFCTPGIVMALYSHLEAKAGDGDAPTAHSIEHCLDGNLCRCTGYRPIMDAAKTFAKTA